MHSAGQLVQKAGLDAIAIPIGNRSNSKAMTLERNVSKKGGSATGVITVAWDNTKPFDEILVGNDVFIFGYPVAIGLKLNPQLDSSRPLIRKGVVAGLNEKRRTIILDLASYGGHSGGPVLEVHQDGPFSRNYRVIGLVSEFIPIRAEKSGFPSPLNPHDVDNSGYTVAVPMDGVFEMLEKHGVVVRE